jgi:predicted O-methyltransferase YrrM
MHQDQWAAVDRCLADAFLPRDEVLDAVVERCAAADLPPIAVSATQGRFLHLLAKMCRARNILEIGTLGGYSTIWLARALPPHGRVLTIELDPRHADIAAENIECAGLSEAVEIRRGSAIDVLPHLASEGLSPFDLVFIDADKESTADYFEWAMQLTQPGSVIVVDNVVRSGAVVDPHTEDSTAQGIRRFLAAVKDDARVTMTALQTVGIKGYDGFAIGIVNERRFF